MRIWIEKDIKEVDSLLKKAFDGTSNYARLQSVETKMISRELFIRFAAVTGDAMGMNMVAKGTEAALKTLKLKFPDMQLISISSNFCTDKKPSAINW